MNFSFSQFLALPSENSPGEFRAIPISLHRRDFIAKGPGGSPIFLLNDSNSINYYPSINFRNISVEFNVSCSVCSGNNELKGDFCIIQFTENLPELYEIFVKCVCSAVENLPEITNTKKLESFILELGELFRTLNTPGGREISGLWSELFIIFISGDPKNALHSWHNDPYDRFDFSNNRMRLEVKSTIYDIRVHEFSLEQLVPHVNGNGYIASVLLKKTSFGCGVFELASKIETLVKDSPELKKKLWGNIIKALGSDFSEKLDKYFDVDFAKKDIRLYLMDDIPKPSNTDDERITNIRFKSNINDLPCSLAISKLNNMFNE
ncbi:PD-(D/E)XK motif protein [Rahnella inusitata]|uniref:PD-(D/E)XK motif protein n=1 Tax=Rahnella inusitata TaxID=58169 RepID=UPI000DD32C51|nr:PD-(D/E)XK motif protein [Rahnella inusitata]